jgi:hypothetical protein
MRRYWTSLLFLATSVVGAHAQSWATAYERALDESKSGNWLQARTDFQYAAHAHGGDVSGATVLPGPIDEQRKWRGGAPFSPNFLAAYCALKAGMISSGDAKSNLLGQAQSEFEAILNRGQNSRETFFFLDETYLLQSNGEKRLELGAHYRAVASRATFRVDTEGVSPDDEALVAQMPIPEPEKAPAKHADRPKVERPRVEKLKAEKPREETVSKPKHEKPPKAAAEAKKPEPKQGHARRERKLKIDDVKVHEQTAVQAEPIALAPPVPQETITSTPIASKPPHSERVIKPAPPVVMPPQTGTILDVPQTNGSSFVGAVAPVPDKFALIIGNSESKMEGGAVPFAAEDAQVMRQSLINNAGYLDQNVSVVINATSQEISAAIGALASRVPEKAAVTIYFTGAGANVDGRDYLAGIDTEASSDSSTMVAKSDMYKAFMAKGARVFAFFQANRPIQNGHYFGSEVPLVGSISQMQATIPGGSIYSIVNNGRTVGLFTNAVTSVLADVKSSRTPILEFGWQVFYKLRRGDTGQFGGASVQTPSLPVLTNMATDARF